jgi:hypothetical protein
MLGTVLRRRGLGYVGCAIAAMWISPALAQAPKADELPRVQVSGKIIKLGRGTIDVAADSVLTGEERKAKAKTKSKEKEKEKDKEKAAAETVVVALHPKNTTVRVSGTSTAKFLRPGQYVRFSGKLDEKNQVAGPIGMVEVFLPQADFQPMLEVRSPAPKFASDDPPPKTRDFHAEGRVLAYYRGQLTVAVDAGKRFTAPVTDTAQVNFTITNFAQVKAGDTINVDGRLYRPGHVLGEMVTISLAPDEKKEKTKEKTKEKVEPKKTDPKKKAVDFDP